MGTFNRKDIRGDLEKTLGAFPIWSGNNEVGSEVFNLGMRQAVTQFSRDVVREIVEDEVGDDGKYYDLNTLLTDGPWEDDFSLIKAIDFDAGDRISSDEFPDFLNFDNGDWEFYEDADEVLYLFLPNHNPTSSQTLRIAYSARHTLNDTDNTTIPDQYREAIGYLATAKIAALLALRTEKALDPPAGAEFVSMRTKSAGFRSIKDMYEAMYQTEIGGDEIKPATARREYDLTRKDGSNFFYHSDRRTRTFSGNR